MSKLNISEAARATDKPRSTIQRNIKKGILSAEKDATGRTVIDVSELQRVFGNLDMDATFREPEQSRAKEQSATGQNNAESDLLRLKLEYTERERDEAQRREREERDRHQETKEEKTRLFDLLEQVQKTIAALPAPAEPATPTDPPKRGLWAWLTGKSG
jgi:hypothetical protein